MKKFIAFDNGGVTSDRFTIINKDTGDVFGAGEIPDAQNGPCKYIGNCADHRIVMYGSGWRQKLPIKKMVKEEAENYINSARLDPNWIGTEVNFNNLPENVREYITHMGSHSWEERHAKAHVVYMAGTSMGILSSSQGQL